MESHRLVPYVEKKKQLFPVEKRQPIAAVYFPHIGISTSTWHAHTPCCFHSETDVSTKTITAWYIDLDSIVFYLEFCIAVTVTYIQIDTPITTSVGFWEYLTFVLVGFLLGESLECVACCRR